MREILFRGKSAFGNEWVYGYLTDGKYYNSEKMFISSFDDSPDRNRQFCRVKPETVGQWTGLVDINSKKIFEGDVVYKKGCGKENFTVCFGEHTVKCCGCCYDYHKIIGFYLDGYNDDEETWDNLEVVGDIYQPKVEITVPTNTGKQTMVVEPWEVEMLKMRALVSEDYSKLSERFYQPIKEIKNEDH